MADWTALASAAFGLVGGVSATTLGGLIQSRSARSAFDRDLRERRREALLAERKDLYVRFLKAVDTWRDAVVRAHMLEDAADAETDGFGVTDHQTKSALEATLREEGVQSDRMLLLIKEIRLLAPDDVYKAAYNYWLASEPDRSTEEIVLLMRRDLRWDDPGQGV